MKLNNEIKLQGTSANVFFPTLLIFLYFEDAFFVIAIYLFFATWFLITELPIYAALLNSSDNGKSYVIKTISLILINGVLAVLVKLQGGDLYKLICVTFLIYSAWFAYFETKKYYKQNKVLLDESFEP